MLALGIHLALQPTARLDTLSWMPGRQWLLAHDFAKNYLSFLILSGTAFLAWPDRSPRANRLCRSVIVLILLMGLGAGLEALQWLVTSRGAEWQDIVARTLAVGTVWFCRSAFVSRRRTV